MYNASDILNSFKELPAMPNVIIQALNVLKDPDSGAKELAKIISYDQSLSTKVLTLVNSAYYGFSQQVTSVARAISLIGMSKAKNIIMTVAMRPMLTNQGDKKLWEHAITTAAGCEYLSKYTRVIDADEAFVVGFLHDLGKIVLKLKDRTLYERIEQSNHTNILEIERSLFGVDHCQIGSILTKRWQLPLLVNNAVKYHHTPNESPMPAACALVYYADALAKENFNPNMLDKTAMKNLNIQIEQSDIFKENILSKAGLLLKDLSN